MYNVWANLTPYHEQALVLSLLKKFTIRMYVDYDRRWKKNVFIVTLKATRPRLRSLVSRETVITSSTR